MSMADLFGNASAAAVSFAARPNLGPEDILVTADDDLDEVDEKLKRAARVVSDGHSLAVILGTLPDEEESIDYIRIAKESMTPDELTQYEAWEKGAAMPALDPARNRKNPGANPGGRTRDQRRLLWLKRAYRNDALDYHNLSYWTATHSALIPALNAGAKVIGAERSRTDGGKQDPRTLAERAAATKIAGAAAARINALQEEHNRLLRSISASQQIVQARKEAMRWEDGGAKPKKTPANEVREAIGLPKIGAPKRWNREGASGRVRDLASGVRETGAETATAGPGPSTLAQQAVGTQGEKRKRAATTRRSKRVAAMDVDETGMGGTRASPIYRPRSPEREGYGSGEP